MLPDFCPLVRIEGNSRWILRLRTVKVMTAHPPLIGIAANTGRKLSHLDKQLHTGGGIEVPAPWLEEESD